MKKKLIILFIIISILYTMNQGFTYKEYYENKFVAVTGTKTNINKKSVNQNNSHLSMENALKILQKNNSKCTYILFTNTAKLPLFISENFYCFNVIENDLEYDSLYCVHKNNGTIYQCWPNGKYKIINVRKY